jgi:hypothetical protein
MPALKPGHGRLSLVRLQVAHALATDARVVVIDGKNSPNNWQMFRDFGPVRVTAADLTELARQMNRRNRSDSTVPLAMTSDGREIQVELGEGIEHARIAGRATFGKSNTRTQEEGKR